MRDLQAYLPLTHLLYAVLLELVEQSDHPYRLVRRIRERSDGRIDPGTGSFYSVLAQAERQGLIREGRTQSETRRRVYEITALGRRVLEAEADRLAGQVRDTHAALRVQRKKAT